MTTGLRIAASVAWLGPGRIAESAVVAIGSDGTIRYAGPAARAPEPEDTQEIAFDGFVMPAAVDHHVHIGLADPRDVVRGGVTVVRDLAWPPDDVLPLARASHDPSFDGPMIRAVGPMITCVGGYPTRAGWAPDRTGREVRGAEDAAAAARSVLATSTEDAVKVALNGDAGPVLTDDELLAVCRVAHEAGAIVTAHVQGAGQAVRALDAGVDEFAHCPWSERLPDDLIAAMARRMRIVSTLDIHSRGRDTPELRTALDNLRRFVAAGGHVLYGTDLGNGPIPPGIHAREAHLLEEAGIGRDAVLAAMASGTLAPGEPADVVGFDADPLEDLAALGSVALVLRRGRRMR